MLKQINTKYLVSFQTEMVGKKRGRKFTSTVYRKIGLSLIQNQLIFLCWIKLFHFEVAFMI